METGHQEFYSDHFLCSLLFNTVKTHEQLFSGLVAERVNLRYYLALGMISSGIAAVLMGMAKYWQIHLLFYFMIIQVSIMF